MVLVNKYFGAWLDKRLEGRVQRQHMCRPTYFDEGGQLQQLSRFGTN